MRVEKDISEPDYTSIGLVWVSSNLY